MFTGIIETTGRVSRIFSTGTNTSFWIESPISAELKPDQSVSHNGVCLTVEEVNGNQHRVTAIAETLSKTNLSAWTEGSRINLERCLQLHDRLDGHIVQGHVDCIATCSQLRQKDGSWEFSFDFPKKFAALVIEKGSIAVDGISLTAFDVRKNRFKVAIIPYTFEHTNLSSLIPGHTVNIEFDLIGKYLLRSISLSEGSAKRKK